MDSSIKIVYFISLNCFTCFYKTTQLFLAICDFCEMFNKLVNINVMKLFTFYVKRIKRFNFFSYLRFLRVVFRCGGRAVPACQPGSPGLCSRLVVRRFAKTETEISAETDPKSENFWSLIKTELKVQPKIIKKHKISILKKPKPKFRPKPNLKIVDP